MASRSTTTSRSGPAANAAPRLALKPALRRMWRSESTVQLGLDPPHAVLLTGLSAPERTVLDLLDGSRDRAAVIAAAAAAGVPEPAAAAVVDLLDRAHLLDHRGAGPAAPRCPEPDLLSLTLRYPEPGGPERVLSRRRDTTVAVVGTGRVAQAMRPLLAAAGVAPAAGAGAGPAALTVVETSTGTVGPEVAAEVRDRPHLLAGVRETTGVVGPFVLPGRTPCLRCVELVRADRDPGWPMIAAHLAGSRRSVAPCDAALASATAALATLHVLTWVDTDGTRRPPSAGGVVELDADGTRLRRRTVAAHPACGCGAG